MSEADLSLARKGDPTAFERLVSPHLKGLYGFIRKRLPQQADDVYQETLLGAWRAITGFKEGSTIKTWLYAIAGFKCMDCIRKMSNSPEIAQLDEEISTSGFEDSSIRSMDIRETLRYLNNEDQTLLYLVYHQGFTQKEAGLILQVPEGTVKSRLNRLKKQLKEKLTGGGSQ